MRRSSLGTPEFLQLWHMKIEGFGGWKVHESARWHRLNATTRPPHPLPLPRGVGGIIDALEDVSLTFGPAEDGAYYLVGVKANRVDGFPDLPILEDKELVRSLERLAKIKISAEYAITASRRCRESDIIRTVFRHQFILIGHLLGYRARHLRELRH